MLSLLTKQLLQNTKTLPLINQLRTVTSAPDLLGRVFTNDLTVHTYENKDVMPTYRIMAPDGSLEDESQDPKLGQETTTKMYTTMLQLSALDDVLYDVQRQGRISFYMTNYGEEATHLGSAAALKPQDVVYAQYREAGVILWRGFGVEQCINQCYSNSLDLGKGRQMPVHYGSRDLNFHTISSPLTTQVPQASGAGYALTHLLKQEDTVSITYFGEGAASEGDFHAALNFASTLDCPTLFFCRNNGFAISTPAREQFRGDGIASRGAGYGMHTIRFDGNDVWAVYNATAKAREIAVTEQRPVLLEAMTYRVGHHSTSDDSTRYRDKAEVEEITTTISPVKRLRAYMEERGWWSQEQEDEFKTTARNEVRAALVKAEKEKKPPISDLFTDVYDTIPQHLQEQQNELNEHLKEYGFHYPIEDYRKE